MLAHLIIVDRFGKTVKNTVVDPANLERAAHKFSELFPECWISLMPQDKSSNEMYSLCPKLMKRDEDRIANDDMTFDDYHEYWYPVKSSKIQEALHQELKAAEAEFTTEDEEDYKALEN